MDLFFDLTIMALLLVTIVYAVRLNSKLNTIRNYRAEFTSNVEAFYDATDKATKAIDKLKKEGEQICKEIEAKISKARLTADEVDFLTSRANRKVLEIREEQEKLGDDVVGFKSVAEAELYKAMRDREFKEALVS